VAGAQGKSRKQDQLLRMYFFFLYICGVNGWEPGISVDLISCFWRAYIITVFFSFVKTGFGENTSRSLQVMALGNLESVSVPCMWVQLFSSRTYANGARRVKETSDEAA